VFSFFSTAVLVGPYSCHTRLRPASLHTGHRAFQRMLRSLESWQTMDGVTEATSVLAARLVGTRYPVPSHEQAGDTPGRQRLEHARVVVDR